MKQLILIALLIFVGGLVLLMSTHNKKPTIESTWMWNTSTLIEEAERYREFMMEKGVSKLYVQIDPSIEVKKYQLFIQEASVNGIDIYAMDGAKDWVYSSNELIEKLAWLDSYQQLSNEQSRFKGLLLDVEPYLLEEWNDEKTSLLEGYQVIVEEAYNYTQENNLPFEVAIPFWFHELKIGGQPFLETISTFVDTYVIMSYRTDLYGENGFHALVEPNFHTLFSNEANIVLTIETETLKGEEKYISFAEKDEADMNDFIKKVNQHYKQYSQFNGVSVHHIESWMDVIDE
ncbi:hypothetical protein N0O92_22705 [Alkalihalobacillus sp. MEB130]|uniref:hypothetical protein n=1 Tax=Alkalihalobacillus sp. MEB130 TaxID=2976704 RepID=UPI0028DEC2A0|nr:hypothetical protein [Alkalihalobacillus sp. MEB130]MDT8862982.1 hypothetical protein [Alkalihalobacillus sp. MEB130]